VVTGADVAIWENKKILDKTSNPALHIAPDALISRMVEHIDKDETSRVNSCFIFFSCTGILLPL
jgi:hypothetical protein